MTDTTEERRIALSEMSNNDFASYLGLHALNLDTLQHDDDVGLNGYAAAEIANRLRHLDRAEAVVEAAEALRRKKDKVAPNGQSSEYEALFAALDAWHTGGTE